MQFDRLVHIWSYLLFLSRTSTFLKQIHPEDFLLLRNWKLLHQKIWISTIFRKVNLWNLSDQVASFLEMIQKEEERMQRAVNPVNLELVKRRSALLAEKTKKISSPFPSLEQKTFSKTELERIKKAYLVPHPEKQPSLSKISSKTFSSAIPSFPHKSSMDHNFYSQPFSSSIFNSSLQTLSSLPAHSLSSKPTDKSWASSKNGDFSSLEHLDYVPLDNESRDSITLQKRKMDPPIYFDQFDPTDCLWRNPIQFHKLNNNAKQEDRLEFKHENP